MFGLGFGEVVVILLVALVFLGPKRLPEVGRKLGEFYRQLRDVSETMKGTLTGELDMDMPTPKVEPTTKVVPPEKPAEPIEKTPHGAD